MDTVAGQHWVAVGVVGLLAEAEGEVGEPACLGLKYLQKMSELHLFAERTSVWSVSAVPSS